MNYFKVLLKFVIPYKYHSKVKYSFFRLRSLLYIGTKVTCPCCSSHFRKFLSYRRSRLNAICPRCGAAERQRLLWLYLKNKTNIFNNNLKVLHFAPEYNLQKNFRSMENLDYTSADLYSSVSMVKMDITNILYKENSFDVILVSHVLEHVIDDRKAMRELFRVLKPGGWAIIQSPIDLKRDQTYEDFTVTLPEDRERVFGNPGHVRIYGRDYKNRLEEAGFNVKLDPYVKEFSDDEVIKYGLDKSEDIYFCIKQETNYV